MFIQQIFVISLVFIAVSGFIQTTDAQVTRFVGYTDGKALFVNTIGEPIWHMMDYCSIYGMYPATVDSAEENDLVATYALNSSTAIWLAAMDHGHEGTFTWLKNGELATRHSEWDDAHPVQDWSANCLVMGSNGKVHSQSCIRTMGIPILCEMKMVQAELPNPKGEAIESRGRIQTHQKPRKGLDESIVAPQSLVVIGHINGKLYYYNQDTKITNFSDALDLCHSYGMKLATPETKAEQDYLKAYSQQLAEAGNPYPHLWTSGSNVATPGCSGTNTKFRWLTTLRDVEIDGNLTPSSRHGCVVVTPDSLYASGCCEGCGNLIAAAVCEMSLD